MGQYVSGASLSKLPFRLFLHTTFPRYPLSLWHILHVTPSPPYTSHSRGHRAERERARVWDGCLIIQSSVKGQESASEPNWHSASYWAPAAGSRVCPAVSLCASGTLEREIDLPYCVNPTLTYRLGSYTYRPMALHGPQVTQASERDHCFSIRTLSGETWERYALLAG